MSGRHAVATTHLPAGCAAGLHKEGTVVTDTPHPAPEPRRRSLLVGSTIVFTLVLAFSMVALIYFRWYTSAEPTSVLTVFGDKAGAGTLVQVMRIDDDKHPPRTIEIRLSEANSYTARFFLSGGVYELVASRSDRPQPLRTSFSLPEGRAMELVLKGLFPATAPTSESTDNP
jgi:hypothetical protein